MKQVRIEYGDSYKDIEVPDSAVVVKPGETFEEPKPIEDPVETTRQVLAEPLNSSAVGDMVGPGAKVVIAFPDRVKGGSHPTAHRRITISLLVEELTAAGVNEKDIKLICAVGLHRKNHREEFATYLGQKIVDRFWGEQLVNHDAEDPEGIVKLGETDRGDVVEVNRSVLEADLTIMLGHTLGNPYGGYSGGYKMPVTGLTTWRSIRCHHTPKTMYREDFTPASAHSHFRGQLTEIGKKIEEAMKTPFFAVDAILDSRSHQTAVFAGRVADVEKASWQAAAKRTQVDWEGEKADILVLGMPRTFHYGPGMGSNPIRMLQAIGASIIRAAGALKSGAVVICASVCDGWFNDEWFPADREAYGLFQKCSRVEEMERFEDELANRFDYIYKYRNGSGYHPFHPFAMLYMGGIALENTRAIYIAGAKAPGYARGIGCIPVNTFDEAVEHAVRYVGNNPKMLIVPEMSKPVVHPRFRD